MRHFPLKLLPFGGSKTKIINEARNESCEGGLSAHSMAFPFHWLTDKLVYTRLSLEVAYAWPTTQGQLLGS